MRWDNLFMRQHALDLMTAAHLTVDPGDRLMPSSNPSLIADFKAAGVIPVLTIREVAHAVPLARALVDGGLPVLEITLRTPVALECVRAIADEVEGAYVGVGTVLSPSDIERSVASGARFAVSPGLTEALIDCDPEIPLLPGVATATEVMRASDAGFTFVKLFPAVPAGGAAFLRAIASPLPHMTFCPTGGVRPANVREFLDLENVACVGGTWLAPDALLQGQDWPAIRGLAAEAVAAARA